MDKVNEKVDKIGVEVKKGFSESYYRFLTVANLALTKVAKPVTESGTYGLYAIRLMSCSFSFS